MKAELTLADLEGRVIAATEDEPSVSVVERLQAFALSGKQTFADGDRDYFIIDYQGRPTGIIEVSGAFKELNFDRIIQKFINLGADAHRKWIIENEFFQRLISQSMTSYDLRGCASELGLEVDTPRVVYAFQMPEGRGMVLAEQIFKELWKQVSDHLALLNWTVPVVIHEITKNDTDALERVLVTCAGKTPGVHIGKSRPFYSLDQLEPACLEAQQAAKAGRIKLFPEDIDRYDDLELELSVTNLSKGYCEGLMRPEIRRFFDMMDSEKERTLYWYYRANMKISAAAKKLYIHRNTLSYRLKSIRKKTGFNLREIQDAMRFEWLWMIHRRLRADNKQEIKDAF